MWNMRLAITKRKKAHARTRTPTNHVDALVLSEKFNTASRFNLQN